MTVARRLGEPGAGMGGGGGGCGGGWWGVEEDSKGMAAQ